VGVKMFNFVQGYRNEHKVLQVVIFQQCIL